ncbi:protein PDF [Lucilia cuprina]|uniref:protein PDF n=1 Tax=Lucilia cuprina TaxID=7375 RepID=UPI001F052B37|nr:protein PDF [Lucilia cuprina]
MVKTLYLMMALVLGLVLASVTSLPTPDEERYFDKEFNRDLINWLASVHYAQSINNPCRYYGGNTLTAPMPKRNSELINSLLSLPKNMNDAGK